MDDGKEEAEATVRYMRGPLPIVPVRVRVEEQEQGWATFILPPSADMHTGAVGY